MNRADEACIILGFTTVSNKNTYDLELEQNEFYHAQLDELQRGIGHTISHLPRSQARDAMRKKYRRGFAAKKYKPSRRKRPICWIMSHRWEITNIKDENDNTLTCERCGKVEEHALLS